MNDQRSVTDQLRDTIQLANEAGMYDAADWIQARLGVHLTTNGYRITCTCGSDLFRRGFAAHECVTRGMPWRDCEEDPAT